MEMISCLCVYAVGLIYLMSTCRSTRDDLIVSTDIGRIRGIRYYLPSLGKTVDAFLGIPFAKPPVGPLRFRHPQPYVPHQDNSVFNATRLPNSCYQPLDEMFGSDFHGSNMWNPATVVSEDCLYLNVWVPKPRLRRSAVMVWIYGGGFYSGTTTLNLYDGKILAAENNVIVVSINYRVGAFGFLFLNDASVPPNAGLFDQLMGLEWIQQNIRSFGGDPNNVTLFGESAGAASVSLHLLSPLSRSKFQRAILQSGTANMPWVAVTMTEALRRSIELAVEILNCPSGKKKKKGEGGGMEEVIECMRNVLPQTLVETQFVSSGVLQFPFLPVIDGTFLPDSPDELLRRKNFKKCPILLGSNLNEGSYFLFYELQEFLNLRLMSMNSKDFQKSIHRLFYYYPQYKQEISQSALDAIIFQYTNWLDPDDDEANILALDSAVGDSQFICSLNHFAHVYASAGQNVYMYFLTQRYSVNPWPRWTGVLHGDDIVFTFGEALKQGLNYSKADADLSRTMMNYWTNFAKTGDPNQISGYQNLEEWPLHSPKGKEYLELNSRFLGDPDKSKAVGRGPRIRECAFWDVYLPRLLHPIAGNMDDSSSQPVTGPCPSNGGSALTSSIFSFGILLLSGYCCFRWNFTHGKY